jgi:hypothetical protein
MEEKKMVNTNVKEKMPINIYIEAEKNEELTDTDSICVEPYEKVKELLNGLALKTVKFCER